MRSSLCSCQVGKVLRTSEVMSIMHWIRLILVSQYAFERITITNLRYERIRSVRTWTVLVNASLHKYQVSCRHYMPVIVKQKQMLMATLWDVIEARSNSNQTYSHAARGDNFRRDWCALQTPPVYCSLSAAKSEPCPASVAGVFRRFLRTQADL